MQFDKEEETSTISSVFVFWLLAYLGVAQMMQEVSVDLLAASLPGDMFINGIILGTTELLSMLLSRVLMFFLPDILAFRVVYAMGAFSYLSLILAP